MVLDGHTTTHGNRIDRPHPPHRPAGRALRARLADHRPVRRDRRRRRASGGPRPPAPRCGVAPPLRDTGAVVGRLHRAWYVLVGTLVVLVLMAGFRSTVGVLLDPLKEEFGWSTA